MFASFPATRRRVLALGAAGAALASAPRAALAAADINITEGNFRPMPIAIPEFIGATAADADSAHALT